MLVNVLSRYERSQNKKNQFIIRLENGVFLSLEQSLKTLLSFISQKAIGFSLFQREGLNDPYLCLLIFSLNPKIIKLSVNCNSKEFKFQTMSYDELLASRIRRVLKNKQASFVEKKMMGGLCFMVNDKMCCGIHFDKKKNTDLLMARVGEKAYPEALKNRHCLPMDFTGKPMKGFVFILPDGYDLDKDLEYWIKLCLDFNPEAKSHK